MGVDAYHIYTTVKFVSSVTLDFESGNTNFDLSVYAQDSDGARTVNDCMVTIVVLDGNDAPSLAIPETARRKHVRDDQGEQQRGPFVGS